MWTKNGFVIWSGQCGRLGASAGSGSGTLILRLYLSAFALDALKGTSRDREAPRGPRGMGWESCHARECDHWFRV